MGHEMRIEITLKGGDEDELWAEFEGLDEWLTLGARACGHVAEIDAYVKATA